MKILNFTDIQLFPKITQSDQIRIQSKITFLTTYFSLFKGKE